MTFETIAQTLLSGLPTAPFAFDVLTHRNKHAMFIRAMGASDSAHFLVPVHIGHAAQVVPETEPAVMSDTTERAHERRQMGIES